MACYSNGRAGVFYCGNDRLMLQVSYYSLFTVARLIDIETRYGRILIEICATLKGAETEITERVLCIENHLKRTSMQLDFLKQIWESLDKEHQTIQTQILQVLISKLKIIISKLEGLSEKRWKYVLIKQCLDKSIEDIDLWQRMFDPSWFLIMKVSSPFIDQEFNRTGSTVSLITSTPGLRNALREQPLDKVSIFLPKDGLDTTRTRRIRFASARCIPKSGSEKWFIVDCVPCDPQVDAGMVTKDVRDLARKLSSVEPLTFGILQCRGVVRYVEPVSGRPFSFDFVFRIPEELSSEPKSLRTYLSSSLELTLTERFELAKQMAKSISYVHTLGFVHKNLRPETVLGFPKIGSGSDLFFLVGFENIRTADGRTLRSGDSTWEKNLYRHPHRQGLNPEDIYTMQHDIYSLGVCLLEVGLWESFLLYDDSTTAPLPAAALSVTLDGPVCKQPALMKEHLVALARRDLPKRMGVRYEQLVINCLTCLDKDNADFGNQSEFKDIDGVLVCVRYIEKVIEQYSFT